MLDRQASIDRITAREPWDLAVIGGGATGVGIALDAASRGYRVCLLEAADFGKGTSSRSTKLIHGGVRYLQQGNIALVMEALKERGILRRNAPHLVHDLSFVVPHYAWWETPFYGIGMKVYDVLAGKYGFGRSRLLSREETLERIPTLETDGLRGGVMYYDGQFDDARLLIALATTAAQQGAALANYCPVIALLKDGDGFVSGLRFVDLESGKEHEIHAHCVINATGPFSDAVRKIDDPAAEPMIAPSQGVHLVLDRSFLPGESAIMVPRTSDGRVMFAIPWNGATLVGTTDTPVAKAELEPVPLNAEIDFLLSTASRYLTRDPQREDIRSMWAGIRPLVRAGSANHTAALSRDHTIQISQSGLLTIAGGKWTTYRRMAKDAVDHAAMLGRLEERPCVTETLPIHQAEAGDELLRAVRQEMARTVEDVLVRRSRLLMLDARAAIEKAPEVAATLAKELGRDQAWLQEQVAAFALMAVGYLPPLPGGVRVGLRGETRDGGRHS